MLKKNEVFFIVTLLGVASVWQGCAPASNENSESPAYEGTRNSENETIQTKPVSSAPVAKNPDGSFKTFVIYSDANSPDNHYEPSGWMGDYGDLQMTQESLKNPHGGSSCIQMSYSAKKAQGAGWAGIYWQNPANNWGSKAGGYDLTGATKLTFWARGEKGGERIEEFKMGGITGDYPDSDNTGIGPVLLTAEWTQYTIDLTGKDLSSISGGFCWVTSAASNPDGLTFHLDDIVYE